MLYHVYLKMNQTKHASICCQKCDMIMFNMQNVVRIGCKINRLPMVHIQLTTIFNIKGH